MKKYIYFLLILLAFSCTKDKVQPIFLPIGYYEITFSYNNSDYKQTTVLQVSKSDTEKITINNDTLKVTNKKVEGDLNLLEFGPKFEIDGYWSYNQKNNNYLINGSFVKTDYAMGGTLILYYYGTFEMIKAK